MTWSGIVFYGVLWLSISIVVSLLLGAVMRRMGEGVENSPRTVDADRRVANDNAVAPEPGTEAVKCGASRPQG